jgi:hypothetical protein
VSVRVISWIASVRAGSGSDRIKRSDSRKPKIDLTQDCILIRSLPLPVLTLRTLLQNRMTAALAVIGGLLIKRTVVVIENYVLALIADYV